MKLAYFILLAVAWAAPKVKLSDDGTKLTITSIWYEGTHTLEITTTDKAPGVFTWGREKGEARIEWGIFQGRGASEDGSKDIVKFSKFPKKERDIETFIKEELVYYKGNMIHPVHIVTDEDIKKSKAVDPTKYKGVHIGLWTYKEGKPDDYLLKIIGIKLGGKDSGMFSCHPNQLLPGEWKQDSTVWGTYKYFDGTNLIFDNHGKKTKKTLENIAAAIVKEDLTYIGKKMTPKKAVKKGNAHVFDYNYPDEYNYYNDSFVYLFSWLLSLGVIGICCCCICVVIGFVGGYFARQFVNSNMNDYKLRNHSAEERV